MKKKLLAALLMLAMLAVCGCASAQDKLEDENIKIARSYRTLFRAADKGEEMNVHISDETVAAIVGTLVGDGYAAAELSGKTAAGNAQLLTDFAAADAAGRQAQVSLFLVCADGGFFRYDLTTGAQGRQCTVSRVYWNGSTPEMTYTESFSVSELSLTDGGYLVFSTPEDYVFVRVTPPDAALAELCAEYVLPVGYNGVNLLYTDWSSDSLGNADLNALFYLLWTRENTANFAGRFEVAEDGMTAYVPAEVFEEVMTAAVSATQQQLRAAARYSSERDAYPVHIVSDADLQLNETDFEPEVRACAENADGSLTLSVCAVSRSLGTDCAFAHELTVMPLPGGGFRYVSNTVLHTGDETLPVYTDLLELTGVN